ncbi:MAG TPA: hypothetical protein VFE63_21945 [Roseiarcus sp.]|jgi:hypothetical protein|nr:hypothetical protein [Roseiarcus sp.]
MLYKTLFALALLGALSLLAQEGTAQETLHQGAWPIQNGFNRQPTPNNQDVTNNQAREVDRLYDELMSSGENRGTHHPGIARMR